MTKLNWMETNEQCLQNSGEKKCLTKLELYTETTRHKNRRVTFNYVILK